MDFLKQMRDGESGDDNTSFAGIYLITFWNSINSVARRIASGPLGIARARIPSHVSAFSEHRLALERMITRNRRERGEHRRSKSPSYA